MSAVSAVRYVPRIDCRFVSMSCCRSARLEEKVFCVALDRGCGVSVSCRLSVRASVLGSFSDDKMSLKEKQRKLDD